MITGEHLTSEVFLATVLVPSQSGAPAGRTGTRGSEPQAAVSLEMFAGSQEDTKIAA